MPAAPYARSETRRGWRIASYARPRANRVGTLWLNVPRNVPREREGLLRLVPALAIDSSEQGAGSAIPSSPSARR